MRSYSPRNTVLTGAFTSRAAKRAASTIGFFALCASVVSAATAPTTAAPTAAATPSASASTTGTPAAGSPAAGLPAAGAPAASASTVAAAPGRWTGPRLEDGQPDVAGVWTNDIANHDNFTAPRGGIPGDPTRLHPLKDPVVSGAATAPRVPRPPAPSRVSDPADGQVPFQPWARAAQQDLLDNFFNPTKPEHVEPGARCAPAGIPKSLYWHGYEVRQFPGVVVFLFNGGTRVIYLDGRPHLPAAIKLWNADSRGHWEGNTLVVDVQNNNAKARFARTGEFASSHVHIVERYTFPDNDHYVYNAVFTDPTVYTRPFTVTIPAHRITEKTPQDEWNNEQEWANRPGQPPLYENYERVCVENNGGHGQLVGAASGAPRS